MAAFAQLERDTMIERTRAGLAAAAANGRKGGRPRKVDDADAAKARQLREKGIAATDIAKMLASPAPPCIGTWPKTQSPEAQRPMTFTALYIAYSGSVQARSPMR